MEFHPSVAVAVDKLEGVDWIVQEGRFVSSRQLYSIIDVLSKSFQFCQSIEKIKTILIGLYYRYRPTKIQQKATS